MARFEDMLKKARFPLGQKVITPGAREAFEEAFSEKPGLAVFAPWHYMMRHGSGDYGEISEHDKAMNGAADISKGDQVMSVYTLPRTGMKIRVCTHIVDEDGNVATFLVLPEED